MNHKIDPITITIKMMTNIVDMMFNHWLRIPNKKSKKHRPTKFYVTTMQRENPKQSFVSELLGRYVSSLESNKHFDWTWKSLVDIQAILMFSEIIWFWTTSYMLTFIKLHQTCLIWGWNHLYTKLANELPFYLVKQSSLAKASFVLLSKQEAC